MLNTKHQCEDTPPQRNDEPDSGLSWDSRRLTEIFESSIHSLVRITVPGALLKDAHTSREPEGRLTRYLTALGGECVKTGTYGLILYAGYIGYQAFQH